MLSTLNCKFIQIAIINFSSSSFHLFLNNNNYNNNNAYHQNNIAKIKPNPIYTALKKKIKLIKLNIQLINNFNAEISQHKS